MKKAIIYSLTVLLSMLIVFATANALAYWYECGKPMCSWGADTKQCVLWFSVATGMMNGAINALCVLEKR